MTCKICESYLFSSLTEKEAAEVAKLTQSISLKEGEMLFRQEEPAQRFYFVHQGSVKLSRFSIDGNEKVIELVDAGQTFAEALMFLDRPRYPVTATALTDCQLSSLDSAAFLDLLSRSTETCFRMMGDMSIRLHRLIKEIDDLSLQSATSRVAGYFCGQLLLGPDTRLGQKIEFRLQVPKSVIASRLSIKPETFSRILQSLSRQEVIEVKGGWVKVLDSAALRGLAESAGVCGGSMGPPQQHAGIS